jgi:hypothetical protein
MRGAPQPGFSTTIWNISSRICLQILLPPPTRFRALHSIAQYRLNPARCQRTTVSGKTRKSVSFHRDQNRSATTQKSLSSGPSFGLGCLRFRTASCWRRARFSNIRPRRLRKVRMMAPHQSRNRSNMAAQVIAEGILSHVPMLVNSKVDGIVTRDKCPFNSLLCSPPQLESIAYSWEKCG